MGECERKADNFSAMGSKGKMVKRGQVNGNRKRQKSGQQRRAHLRLKIFKKNKTITQQTGNHAPARVEVCLSLISGGSNGHIIKSPDLDSVFRSWLFSDEAVK